MTRTKRLQEREDCQEGLSRGVSGAQEADESGVLGGDQGRVPVSGQREQAKQAELPDMAAEVTALGSTFLTSSEPTLSVCLGRRRYSRLLW